jgi:uncharacterized YigZ family protein
MKVHESQEPPRDVYRTLAAPAEGLFKDRGSRFIAKAYPVETVEEIRRILESLRKEYHDARHHCHAYRLGPGEGSYRVNDDGEPANSAGKPIYGQILAHNLTNILIVVIRYFGGTLLGVGGLINAYRTAAREALDHGTIIQKTFDSICRVSFPYPAMNDIMKILKEEKAEITSQEHGESCTIDFRIRKGYIQKIFSRLNRIEQALAVENPCE